MRFAGSARVIFAVCVLVLNSTSHAEDIADTLNVAWESFWHQSGFPRAVVKWNGPVLVRFSGESAARHKEFMLRQLRAVFEVSEIPLAEAADDNTANLVVEVVNGLNVLPANEPCVTNYSWRNFIIQRAKVTANEHSVWRCMLHESMHVMGIPGHPMGNTVLTYFARSDRLTEIDKLLLKTIYSSDVKPGMSPFAVLNVLAGRLGDASGDAGKNDARQTAKAFLLQIMKEMEAFANGTGEAPSIVLRSGKATSVGLAQGRTDIQYFLGTAYLNGHIVEPDRRKAIEWIGNAAAASHGGAQRLLKSVSEAGEK
jgi:Protein of unknown function (DUF2927)